MEMMSEQEARIEREQVEIVFGLGGGELEDKPWEYERPWADPMLGTTPGRSRYWFSGCPDYVERHEREEWDWPSARTIIDFGYPDAPHPWLVDDEGAWILVQIFYSHGEAECPYRTWDPIAQEDHQGKGVRLVAEAETCHNPESSGLCPMCEEKTGEEHGYIYLADGYEAVYSLVEESTMTREEWEEEHDEK